MQQHRAHPQENQHSARPLGLSSACSTTGFSRHRSNSQNPGVAQERYTPRKNQVRCSAVPLGVVESLLDDSVALPLQKHLQQVVQEQPAFFRRAQLLLPGFQQAALHGAIE